MDIPGLPRRNYVVDETRLLSPEWDRYLRLLVQTVNDTQTCSDFDGGRADTVYGGEQMIDCGTA